MIEMELLAEMWVGGDVGGLVPVTVEVERTDLDEVQLAVRPHTADETQHVYLARDRALRLGHALIEAALVEWADMTPAVYETAAILVTCTTLAAAVAAAAILLIAAVARAAVYGLKTRGLR